MRAVLICCLFLLTRVPELAAAPPKLNYLFPAGAQRGQTVAVTANGSWDSWPVTAWVDRSGLQLTAEKEKGQLKATVDASAEPGVFWLRLTNADGATTLKPFVVGMLPEIVEQEPNDDPAKPQVLDKPTVVNGRFGKREDVDTFAMQLTKGQTMVVALQANTDLRSAVDGVLQVCSADRFVLQQNNDARGLDPALSFTAPADGLYLIRAFGFPATPDSSISFAGNDAHLYRMTITTAGFIDYALPLAISRGSSTDVDFRGWNIAEAARRFTAAPAEKEFVIGFHPDSANCVLLPVVPHPSIVADPDNGRSTPQLLTRPTTVSGVIESPRDEDVFIFTAKKGESIEFEVESEKLGFLLDASLAVTDSSGKVLAEPGDSSRPRGRGRDRGRDRVRGPQLSFSAQTDGEFYLTIQDAHGHGGPRHVYRLTVRESKADFELKTSADTFVVKRGGTLEIPITVERTNGFDQEIEIVAVGLPTGVAGVAVKSLAKGETANSVKLSVQASAEAQTGPFQVLGKTSGELPMERRAQLGGDGTPATVSHAWITVTADK